MGHTPAPRSLRSPPPRVPGSPSTFVRVTRPAIWSSAVGADHPVRKTGPGICGLRATDTMPRRRTGRKRGRPRLANARRRATTRAGRRGEIDYGSELLRARKRRATGREDLEIDGASVLFGHDHLDRQQFDTLGLITDWLRRAARAWGLKDGSCGGLWEAVLGAATARQGRVDPTPLGSDYARRRLAAALQRLDGSKVLVDRSRRRTCTSDRPTRRGTPSDRGRCDRARTAASWPGSYQRETIRGRNTTRQNHRF